MKDKHDDSSLGMKKKPAEASFSQQRAAAPLRILFCHVAVWSAYYRND